MMIYRLCLIMRSWCILNLLWFKTFNFKRYWTTISSLWRSLITLELNSMLIYIELRVRQKLCWKWLMKRFFLNSILFRLSPSKRIKVVLFLFSQILTLRWTVICIVLWFFSKLSLACLPSNWRMRVQLTIFWFLKLNLITSSCL
jgi:hypothetical protein